MLLMNFYKATKLRQRHYPLAKETSTSTSNDTQENGEKIFKGLYFGKIDPRVAASCYTTISFCFLFFIVRLNLVVKITYRPYTVKWTNKGQTNKGQITIS